MNYTTNSPEVIALSKKILSVARKQNPVILGLSLCLCLELINWTTRIKAKGEK